MISLSGVALDFERDGRATSVMHGVDLDVAAGEFVAIVGPSGIGKSSLLRLVAALIAPTQGKIAVHARRKPDGLAVALVFQDARLLPWRTVLDNVAFGLERWSVPRPERRARSLEALSLVGLAEYEQRLPHELSGGQRQRVAIARALAVDPDILLMDEPFGALDALTRETLQDELARIHAATGKTVLFVTHSIAEAAYLADRTIAMVGAPARLGAQVRSEAPRPRRRGDPALADAEKALRAILGASDREAAAA